MRRPCVVSRMRLVFAAFTRRCAERQPRARMFPLAVHDALYMTPEAAQETSTSGGIVEADWVNDKTFSFDRSCAIGAVRH